MGSTCSGRKKQSELAKANTVKGDQYKQSIEFSKYLIKTYKSGNSRKFKNLLVPNMDAHDVRDSKKVLADIDSLDFSNAEVTNPKNSAQSNLYFVSVPAAKGKYSIILEKKDKNIFLRNISLKKKKL